MEEFLDSKLHEAVRYGDTNLVESALKEDLNPNAIGLYLWSPLHEAASNGDLEILSLLLQYEGDPNAKDCLHGCTAVHYACREGHVDCLEALLEMGGRHDVANNDGETGLDVAVGKCREILDRKRAKKLISTSLKEKLGQSDNEVKVSQDYNPETTGKDSVPNDREESASPHSSIKSDTPIAWDAIEVQETNAEPVKDAGTGYLQLSFEYNSHTSVMKIRVWQLEDILLPPAEVANITRLSIKSRLLPDKKGETKRKTEDARLEDPVKMKTIIVSVKRKSAKESFKAIYLPCTFLFTKPLEYKHITKEIVESKMVHIDVNVKHKYTNKSFTVANLQLPLKEAVRRLRKRKYRLHPCINYSMPDNIHSYDPSDLVIVSEGMYSNKTVSNPNLRSSSKQSLKVEGEQRASSDINLQTVRCHSTDSIPSVSLNIPDDDQDDGLQAITIMNDSPRSTHLSHSNPEVHVVEIHEMDSILPGTTDSDLAEVKVEASLRKLSKSTPNIPVLQIEDLEGDSPPKKITRPTSPPNRLTVPPVRYNRPRKQSLSSRPTRQLPDVDNLKKVSDNSESSKDHEPPRPGRVVLISSVQKDLGGGNSHEIAQEMTSYSNPAGVFHISEHTQKGLDRKKDAIRSKVKEKKKQGSKEGHHKLLRTFSEKEGVDSPVFQSDEDHSRRVEYSEISELPTNQGNLPASKFNMALGQKPETAEGKTSQTRSKKKDAHLRTVLPMAELTLSPTRLPEVHTISETQFGHLRPTEHSTPKKTSHRDQAMTRPPYPGRMDPSSASMSQSNRDRIKAQDFPQAITRGLMHTEFTRPTSPQSLSPHERLSSPEDMNAKSRSPSPGSDARVHFLSETETSDHRQRQTSPARRIRSPVHETRSKSPRRDDPVELEMSPLQLDPTFQKKMATPEFKLQMFQRTSQDPHPSEPYVIKSKSARKKQLFDSQEEVTDSFFVPESPVGSPMAGGSVVNSSRHEGGSVKSDSRSDGKAKLKRGEMRPVENQSVVRVKQSWL